MISYWVCDFDAGEYTECKTVIDAEKFINQQFSGSIHDTTADSIINDNMFIIKGEKININLTDIIYKAKVG